VIGVTAYDIAPRELADRYKAADDELFLHPGSQVYEGQVLAADGQYREMVFTRRPMVSPATSAAAWFA
jgi:hypothetical protein